MGLGHCGKDAKGREIGYAIVAFCDHPGCKEVIDRGLSYACGNDHGGGEHGCGKYFCAAHRIYTPTEESGWDLCESCSTHFKNKQSSIRHRETRQIDISTCFTIQCIHSKLSGHYVYTKNNLIYRYFSIKHPNKWSNNDHFLDSAFIELHLVSPEEHPESMITVSLRELLHSGLLSKLDQ